MVICCARLHSGAIATGYAPGAYDPATQSYVAKSPRRSVRRVISPAMWIESSPRLSGGGVADENGAPEALPPTPGPREDGLDDAIPPAPRYRLTARQCRAWSRVFLGRYLVQFRSTCPTRGLRGTGCAKRSPTGLTLAEIAQHRLDCRSLLHEDANVVTSAASGSGCASNPV